MKSAKENQHAYLIRCWHVDSAIESQEYDWRFSVEAADSPSNRHGFTDPQALINFIMEQVTTAMDASS